MGYYVRIKSPHVRTGLSTWLGPRRQAVLGMSQAQYYPHPTAAIEAAHGWFLKEESIGVDSVEIIRHQKADGWTPWKTYNRPARFKVGDYVCLAPSCGLPRLPTDALNPKITSILDAGAVELDSPLAGTRFHNVLSLRHR